MARFRLDCAHRHGTLRLLLHGVFDGSSAWEIRLVLAHAAASRVILDFAGIQEVWEFGAAVLGQGLRELDRSRIAFANLPDELRLAFDRLGAPVPMAGTEGGCHLQ